MEAAEPAHRMVAPLDAPAVLFDFVVQVLAAAVDHPFAQRLPDGAGIGRAGRAVEKGYGGRAIVPGGHNDVHLTPPLLAGDLDVARGAMAVGGEPPLAITVINGSMVAQLVEQRTEAQVGLTAKIVSRSVRLSASRWPIAVLRAVFILRALSCADEERRGLDSVDGVWHVPSPVRYSPEHPGRNERPPACRCI